MSNTMTAGLFYLGQVAFTGGTTAGFGLMGVCTTAMRSTLRKESLYSIGDSINTNNGGAVSSAATNQNCPILLMSVSGGRASYHQPTFSRYASVAGKIGATRFVSNFGTNDLSAGRTRAQLQSDLQSMRSLAAAQGVLFTQCTLLPKTSRQTITTSAQSASGNTMQFTVPDGTKFVVGGAYTVAGAADAGYNGTKFITGIAGNVLTTHCATGTPATTTGTVTITSRNWSTRALQTPVAGFEAGASSDRGLQNAYIRTSGNFDGYIDWGDACEVTRDDGVFAVYGEKPEMDATQLTTVKALINISRFRINGTWGQNAAASGVLVMLSGVNIGEIRGVNGNSSAADDWTLSTALPLANTVGDQLYAATGSYPSDDGIHPRVATGTVGAADYRGGQALIVNKTITWLQGLLA
jgi:hypothetical protein